MVLFQSKLLKQFTKIQTLDLQYWLGLNFRNLFPKFTLELCQK